MFSSIEGVELGDVEHAARILLDSGEIIDGHSELMLVLRNLLRETLMKMTWREKILRRKMKAWKSIKSTRINMMRNLWKMTTRMVRTKIILTFSMLGRYLQCFFFRFFIGSFCSNRYSRIILGLLLGHCINFFCSFLSGCSISFLLNLLNGVSFC